MGMVEKSDLLLLNGKAILFCGMRTCFALTFCGGISFCCLKRQKKENGHPEVTGKTSVIPTTSVLCTVLPLLLSLAPFPQPAALQSWKQGPAELSHSLGAVLQAGTLQAHRHTLQSPFVQGTPAPQALLLFKWPRADKRSRDVSLTPDQTQPQCPVTYQGLLASVWSSWLVPLKVENRFNLGILLGSSHC